MPNKGGTLLIIFSIFNLLKMNAQNHEQDKLVAEEQGLGEVFVPA